ncbi:ArsR/SmtB family transcription factor [Murimonas intestini]|uniref:Transcriptional regulator n=1 Tax=Murimonas intestini TaxID=1337051 RepID=A0AB73T6F9_9FIRM|nr:helix-turn-helix domain-containing protein [Murimonas intestini]MCR1839632.1 helix-turn-helix domain-containing protein [Murimonas intestini]MCR1866475.1 helix-turn-helix domain-containing protein [Murimonas intestini]MCR1882407.1 helix-turn-helix domain-containing protein [Murimonas intestini]
MNGKICMNLEDKGLAAVGKALSSKTRLELLKLLGKEPLSINEIAEKMDIPPSSAAMHVRVLEEAGLIRTELKPGIRGSMKVCMKTADSLEIELDVPDGEKHQVQIVSMPIGNFVDYEAWPTCGIVGSDGHIDEEDEPRCFYNPKRVFAQLIWFGRGYLEYRFPNVGVREEELKKVELSMEICSETADYNMECPSDITVWINGVDAGTWECPSDFGGRRGKLNPEWWPDKNTQYGMLKTWCIAREGTKLDGRKVSALQIEDYHLTGGPYISVRIGIKEDAGHVGGVNLFGEGFGDHPQNILLKFFY